jgi:hypothetical protein
MRNHLCPYRVEFDVALTGKQVRLGIDQAGAEAPLPQSACTLIGMVDVLHIALSDTLHQARWAIGTLGRQQQMHVIGHQHIGVQAYPYLLTEALQESEIVRIVGVGKETGSAVMPALDDVEGNTGKFQARTAGA